LPEELTMQFKIQVASFIVSLSTAAITGHPGGFMLGIHCGCLRRDRLKM